MTDEINASPPDGSLPSNVVVLGAVYWNGSLTQRPQRLHRSLARHFDSLLYVEKPRNLVSVFFPRRVRGWSRFTDFLRVRREVAPKLTAMTATYYLPYKRTGRLFSRLKWFESINQRLLARGVKRTLKRRRVDDYILWIEDVKWLPFLDWLEPSLIVYDCMDDRAAYPEYTESVREAIRRGETKIDRRADVVLAMSRAMLDRYGNPHRYLLENATDVEAFEAVAYRPEPAPTRPQVGYIGSLKQWLDYDLLIDLARETPEWDFVYVGGPDTSAPLEKIETLRRLPNVVMTGQVEAEALPALMEKFSVATIPNRMDDPFGMATHPCKVYEYMACGKPVVAAPMAELEQYGEALEFAATREEWRAALRRGVEENDPARAERRREIARRNSWPRRVEKLVGYLRSPEIIKLAERRRRHRQADGGREDGSPLK